MGGKGGGGEEENDQDEGAEYEDEKDMKYATVTTEEVFVGEQHE